MASMKAAVISEAGGPEMLKVEPRPVPEPRAGQLLIRVRAFGLNRSELFTRQGHLPGVRSPRILGIEAVGVVEAAMPSSRASPRRRSRWSTPGLPWATPGALPDILQTAWGSLFRSLRLEPGESLLIRGGTTSVGLAAAAIARNHGASVAAMTRTPHRAALLRASGADRVFVDTGTIAPEIRAAYPQGVDKVLELVGTTTLEDSMRCVRPGGTACMTGIVGNRWSFEEFSPMEAIPTAVCLTSYAGESADFMRLPLADLVEQVAAGTLPVQVGKTFTLDQIVEAHRCLEENRAGGKIVVLTDPDDL